MRIVQSWDTAIKTGAGNDRSACVTFAEMEQGHYLLDAYAERLDFPALRQRVLAHAEQWKAQAVLIEDAASGQSLLQELRRSSALPVIAIRPRMDKAMRLASVSAMIEAGRVWLPQEAPWLAEFEHELMGFPHAKHDDLVDAFTQYLLWATRRHGSAQLRRV